ncbi:hypothetical protein LY78DRAFT_728575, partial [Colletotrichum sublineola]
KIIIYLQITANTVNSLEQTTYSKTNTRAQNPPYLNNVYKQLKNIHSVTRLKFQPHSSKGIQLAIPLKFNPKEISNDMAQSTFKSAKSLATASMFSLYFQHNILTAQYFQECLAAVLQPPTEELRKSYKDMLDVKRLYNSHSGRVHKPHGHRHGSPPTREGCSSPASATTASYGSTLAFETKPRPKESPPPYAKRKLPTVRSDAAVIAISAKSPSHVPPRYSCIKRVRHYGSKDTNIHPTATKHPFTTVCTTRTTAGGASRPEKIPQVQFVDPDQSKVKLLFTLQRQKLKLQQELELQGQAIEQLQKDVKELRREKNKLKGRHNNLQADYANLKEHQDRTKADMEDLSINIIELKGKYNEVAEQIPDVCDEFEN